MKIDEEARVIELTERNLKVLLAKLAGYPDYSACTIAKFSDQMNYWYIKAVPDETHYNEDTPPGYMHPDSAEATATIDKQGDFVKWLASMRSKPVEEQRLVTLQQIIDLANLSLQEQQTGDES